MDSEQQLSERLKQSSISGYWASDREHNECLLCGATFSFLRRKHHCRVCGEIVCSNCSPHHMSAPKLAELVESAQVSTSSETDGQSEGAGGSGGNNQAHAPGTSGGNDSATAREASSPNLPSVTGEEPPLAPIRSAEAASVPAPASASAPSGGDGATPTTPLRQARVAVPTSPRTPASPLLSAPGTDAGAQRTAAPGQRQLHDQSQPHSPALPFRVRACSRCFIAASRPLLRKCKARMLQRWYTGLERALVAWKNYTAIARLAMEPIRCRVEAAEARAAAAEAEVAMLREEIRRIDTSSSQEARDISVAQPNGSGAASVREASAGSQAGLSSGSTTASSRASDEQIAHIELDGGGTATGTNAVSHTIRVPPRAAAHLAVTAPPGHPLCFTFYVDDSLADIGFGIFLLPLDRDADAHDLNTGAYVRASGARAPVPLPWLIAPSTTVDDHGVDEVIPLRTYAAPPSSTWVRPNDADSGDVDQANQPAVAAGVAVGSSLPRFRSRREVTGHCWLPGNHAHDDHSDGQAHLQPSCIAGSNSHDRMVLALQFDNRHSRLRSKTVHVKIGVVDFASLTDFYSMKAPSVNTAPAYRGAAHVMTVLPLRAAPVRIRSRALERTQDALDANGADMATAHAARTAAALAPRVVEPMTITATPKLSSTFSEPANSLLSMFPRALGDTHSGSNVGAVDGSGRARASLQWVDLVQTAGRWDNVCGSWLDIGAGGGADSGRGNTGYEAPAHILQLLQPPASTDTEPDASPFVLALNFQLKVPGAHATDENADASGSDRDGKGQSGGHRHVSLVAVYALPPLQQLMREQSAFSSLISRFVGVGAAAKGANAYRDACLRVLLHWVEAGWVVRGVTAGLSEQGAALGSRVPMRYFGRGQGKSHCNYLEIDAEVSASRMMASLFAQLYNRGPELDLVIGFGLAHPSDAAVSEAAARRAARGDSGDDDGADEDRNDGVAAPSTSTQSGAVRSPRVQLLGSLRLHHLDFGNTRVLGKDTRCLSRTGTSIVSGEDAGPSAEQKVDGDALDGQQQEPNPASAAGREPLAEPEPEPEAKEEAEVESDSQSELQQQPNSNLGPEQGHGPDQQGAEIVQSHVQTPERRPLRPLSPSPPPLPRPTSPQTPLLTGQSAVARAEFSTGSVGKPSTAEGTPRMQTLIVPAGTSEQLVFDVFPGSTLCWKFVVEEIGADVGFTVSRHIRGTDVPLRWRRKGVTIDANAPPQPPPAAGSSPLGRGPPEPEPPSPVLWPRMASPALPDVNAAAGVKAMRAGRIPMGVEPARVSTAGDDVLTQQGSDRRNLFPSGIVHCGCYTAPPTHSQLQTQAGPQDRDAPVDSESEMEIARPQCVVLSFDNSYSRLRSKTIRLTVRALDFSGVADEDALLAADLYSPFKWRRTFNLGIFAVTNDGADGDAQDLGSDVTNNVVLPLEDTAVDNAVIASNGTLGVAGGSSAATKPVASRPRPRPRPQPRPQPQLSRQRPLSNFRPPSLNAARPPLGSSGRAISVVRQRNAPVSEHQSANQQNSQQRQTGNLGTAEPFTPLTSFMVAQSVVQAEGDCAAAPAALSAPAATTPHEAKRGAGMSKERRKEKESQSSASSEHRSPKSSILAEYKRFRESGLGPSHAHRAAEIEHEKLADKRLHDRTRAWTRQFLRRQMAQWCCERLRAGQPHGFEQYLCEMMPDNIKTDDAGNVTWVDERVQGTVRGTFEQAHREQVVLSERARTSTMTASAPAAAAEVAPSESVTGGGLNTDRDTEQTEQARAPAAVLDSDAAASVSETASTSSSAPAPESTAAASSDDPVHVPL